MIAATAKRSELFTPFRYPGGKSALYRFFCRVLSSNDLSRVTYVEPYAGGAGAALALLFTERVEQIVINDLDRAMYAAWFAMINSPDKFMSLVSDSKLTIDEWDRNHQIYMSGGHDDLVRLGFAAFYLNRTSRSGVLTAGPIGGREQLGNYKMDARFNRETIRKRVAQLQTYRNRISISNSDGADVIAQWAPDPNAFLYVDPPYFVKGNRLYLNSFTVDNHVELSAVLNAANESPWILTYDDVPEIRALYSDRRQDTLKLNYSLQRVSQASELIVFSDRWNLPEP